MKKLLSICLLLSTACLGQRDSLRKPEVFSSGFLDVINNGQVHAAARLLRVYIGEPGKWTLPVSMYSGVSANNFQNQYPAGSRSNDHLVNQLINPMSGMLNVSMEGLHFMNKNTRHTKWALLGQAGQRLLTGYRVGSISDPATGKPVQFLSPVASGGIYFQTAAWERSRQANMGVFWLSWRYIATHNAPGSLRNILPGIATNGWYTGWSIGWGMEISQVVHIKLVYYKYTKAPELDYGRSLYQFSFQYAWKP